MQLLIALILTLDAQVLLFIGNHVDTKTNFKIIDTLLK